MVVVLLGRVVIGGLFLASRPVTNVQCSAPCNSNARHGFGDRNFRRRHGSDFDILEPCSVFTGIACPISVFVVE